MMLFSRTLQQRPGSKRPSARVIVSILLSLVVLVFGQSGVHTFATNCPKGMSRLDCAALYGQSADWVPDHLSACSGGSTTLTGTTIGEKIWNYLVGTKQLTPQQAAGVMGNMQAESGLVPTRHQGTGDVFNSRFDSNAWGLVQWDGGRRYSAPDKGVLGALRKNKPELVKYTDTAYDTVRNPSANIPAADGDALLNFELDYLYDESNSRPVSAKGFGNAGNEWSTLKLQQTVANATVFWHNNFEVSADSADRVLQTRGGYADTIYSKYSGKTATGSAASGSCAAGTGNLNATVLAYAWPTYKGSPYMQRMPEYINAVNSAINKGIYVGGYAGVDCGGFVTLLMINSGFEPKYNYAGKSSSGAGNVEGGQTPWLKANWTSLGSSSSINPSKLQPGDVAVSSEHTFVWVGDIPGFGSKIASASFGDRAPMADTAQSPTQSGFTWYRKK